MSLPWAEFISFWANWVLIGALVIGVVATYGIVVSGNVKETAAKLEVAKAGADAEAAKRDAATANEKAAVVTARAAQLETDAAEARKETARLASDAETARSAIASAQSETARANENAATANARAGALEKDAASARLETAEIMKSTAWRQLLPEQGQAFESSLATHAGEILLAWVANDPESLGLAIQFSKLLDAAKWKYETSSMTFAGSLIWGLRVPDSNSGDTAILRSALAAAGIAFSADALPPQSMSFGAPPPNDTKAVLFIGSKRPTFAIPLN